jgi:hypothetical protein
MQSMQQSSRVTISVGSKSDTALTHSSNVSNESETIQSTGTNHITVESGINNSKTATVQEDKEVFTCTTCNMVKPRNEFFKSSAKKPELCTTCAEKRRKENKRESKKNHSKGENKDKERLTLFISKRSQIILRTLSDDVLDKAQSQVIEDLLEEKFQLADEKVKKLIHLKCTLIEE